MGARKKAGLGDLHVHDLRQAVAMRPREAAIQESTIADIRWRSRPTMPQPSALAQALEIRLALEKIKTTALAGKPA